MGPPELPGGNGADPFSVATWRKALQWGRRNYPAETCARTGMELETAFRLQWGRRNYPAETRRRRPRIPGGKSGFNGAAGITRRKLARAGEVQLRNRASMGPPELPGGNAGVAEGRYNAI